MKVKYFQRKPIPNFHFSVENIFNDVRSTMPPEVEVETHVYGHFSHGLANRLLILWETWRHRSEVNHITGDINFSGIVLPKKRTVQTILDLFFLEKASGLKFAIQKLFWLTLPVRRAGIVTVISEATKQDILRRMPGADPSKIHVVPIALGPVFKYEPRSHNWERPTLLQIGSAPNKNVPRILAALRGLPCRLIMVSEHTPEYEELCKKHGIEYEYRHGLDKHQMRDLYKNVDIVVFPSLLEGFGMPIIEAQAMGALVVTSNISSMPEVAGDGAILVDPFSVESIREGIDSLLKDPSLREKLLEKGFENAKRFDSAAISRQYLELYKRLVGD